MLLSTIISRCRPVKLHPWNDAYVRQILIENGAPEQRIEDAVRAAAGSIGRAWTIANDESYWKRRDSVMQRFFCMTQRSDVVKVSGELRDEAKSTRTSAEDTLDDLSDLLRTLMMVRLGRYEKDAVDSFPQPWRRAANEAPLHVFTDLLDAVSEARKMLESNVTWQATTERLMLNMMEEMNKWST